MAKVTMYTKSGGQKQVDTDDQDEIRTYEDLALDSGSDVTYTHVKED